MWTGRRSRRLPYRAEVPFPSAADVGGPPVPLRRHQAEALAAVDAATSTGRTHAWVVLPPGAGKTYVGLEVVRRLGRPGVVFGPNTALLEVWGRLLAQVLDHLPEAFVPGLAATPPQVLDRDQAALVEELFSDITYAASIPAAVREATLFRR